ncbi:MAG TPA: T9SS type A sorting domain-containing protein, partial [Candidatus Coatesbacteria bacterium]|nr:T9SS type A sorting domain-containing protein [Candidatus Coatesbacteria bacterium]
ELTSSILDITEETEWGWVLWEADEPAGTDVTLSVRSSDDPERMGSWSEVGWGADLGDEYPQMQGYLQYRAALQTTDEQSSPTFSSVEFHPYFHLSSPPKGGIVSTLTPTLDWEDTVLPAFDTYTVWWGTDPSFGDYNEVGGIVDSSYRIASGVSDGDVIYWRVKAVDGSSHAFWAPERDWSFTVDLDFDVELSSFAAQLADEGVLVSWSFSGEVPAGVRVLRESEGETVPLHTEALPGAATRWLDRELAWGVDYRYWLEVTTQQGVTTRFGPTEAVRLAPEALVFGMEVPYPQPAEGAVHFRCTLPDDGRVTLSVYDLSGRRVAVVVDAELAAGRHEVAWDSSAVPPGVYLYRLTAGAGALTGRLVVSR